MTVEPIPEAKSIPTFVLFVAGLVIAPSVITFLPVSFTPRGSSPSSSLESVAPAQGTASPYRTARASFRGNR